MKAFADNNLDLTQIIKLVPDGTKNIVGKAENAVYKHFLFFPQCSQKISFSGSLKPVILCGEGLILLGSIALEKNLGVLSLVCPCLYHSIAKILAVFGITDFSENIYFALLVLLLKRGTHADNTCIPKSLFPARWHGKHTYRYLYPVRNAGYNSVQLNFICRSHNI